MKFEYECWKCGEWHKTDFEGFTASLSYGFAKTRISILGLPIVIPNFVGEYEMWKWRKEINARTLSIRPLGNPENKPNNKGRG